jgi:hypothetical protein
MKKQFDKIVLFKYIDKLRIKMRKLLMPIQFLITFFIFNMIILIPSVVSYLDKPRYIVSPTNVLLHIILFLLFVGAILYFRGYIGQLVKKFEKELHTFQDLLGRCYKECLKRHAETFRNKLLFENRERYRKKLREIEEEERLKTYHHSRVESLRQEAELIAASLEMKLEHVDTFLPNDTYKKDVSQVMEYALFNEKHKIKDIIIDVKQHNDNVYAYGNIDYIVLKEIEVGE